MTNIACDAFSTSTVDARGLETGGQGLLWKVEDPIRSGCSRIARYSLAAIFIAFLGVDTSFAQELTLPTIVNTGAVRVHHSLIAQVSHIEDDNGAQPFQYSFQWFRADDRAGLNETEISSGRQQAYRLTNDDVDKFVRVRIQARPSFNQAPRFSEYAGPVLGSLGDNNPVISIHPVTRSITEGEDVIFRLTRDGDTTDELEVEYNLSSDGDDVVIVEAFGRKYRLGYLVGFLGMQHLVQKVRFPAGKSSHDFTIETRRYEEPANSDVDKSDSIVSTVSVEVGSRNFYTAHLEERYATATILNDDGTRDTAELRVREWIARFGRTVADQIIDAIEARMTASRATGTQMTVGGRSLGSNALTRDTRTAEALEVGEQTQTLFAGPGDARRNRFRSHDMSQQDLLLGTSFSATSAEDRTGNYAVWGRGSTSGFDGRTDDLSISGKVDSAMLGADWSNGRTTSGLILGHSSGSGDNDNDSTGDVSSTLIGLYPWGSYEFSRRVTLWGVAGYGKGDFTVTSDVWPAMTADLNLLMGAGGIRGVIQEATGTGELELAVKVDAMGVRTRSDAVNKDGGRVAASDASVGRLRIGFEGSSVYAVSDGSTVTPSFGIGLSKESGNVETGSGIEIGAGLNWLHPARGLSMDLRGRGLVYSTPGDFKDYSISASLGWNGGSDHGRGPSLTLNQTIGRLSSSGMDALLGRDSLAGLGTNGNGDALDDWHLDAEFGYGFSVIGGQFIWTPMVGVGFHDAGSDMSLGWRLSPIGSDALSLVFEAKQHDHHDSVGIALGVRY